MNYLFSMLKSNNKNELDAYFSVFGNDIIKYGCQEILHQKNDSSTHILLLDYDKKTNSAFFKVQKNDEFYTFQDFESAFYFYEKNCVQFN